MRAPLNSLEDRRVTTRNSLGAAKLGLLVGFLWLPLLGWTQSSTPSQAEIWRQANEAVGQFKRGHADVLKWEQGRATPEAQAPTAANTLSLASAADAVRLAWKLHPDLRLAMARLGGATEDAIASAHWDQVDPRLVRRIEGTAELLQVAAQVRKEFATAQAAQLTWQQAKEMLQASESARELGDRMVHVGNWSKIQQAPLQMAQVAAQMNLQKARLATIQAQGRLLKLLGPVGMYQSVAMPGTLQSLPKSILSEQDVQSRGAAFQEQSYYADRFVNRDNVFQAYAAYQGAFATATLAQEVLKLHQFVTEETVLHYNGMLKSTWDVLTESQNQIQASSAAVNAQRDFEMARIDLEWVLLGGEPAGFVSLAGGDAAPAAGQ
jgi:hypothetical protein